MASACVNNIGMSPDKFPPATYPTYGWLSPRISFSREFPDDDASRLPGAKASSPSKSQPEVPDPEISACEFEFRLEDPVAMLPADELFSGGKLMPLQFSSVKPPVNDQSTTGTGSPDTAKYCRRPEISGADPYLFSPKAPRCSSRWRELLGLKKLYQNSNATAVKSETQKTTSSATATTNAPKSLKHFLHRSSKSLSSSSSSDASMILPLLKDSDCESVSISSRLSLSSSSSGHEHDDLPRLSLDSDKPNHHQNPIISIHRTNPKHARVRTVKTTREAIKQRTAAADQAARAGRSPMRRPVGESATVASRGVSVDSPRMNSSGKIIFQSLERSSSSPSSFNGGPRLKHRGMERSYSANVRVTPVLNVPVCSLRGSSKSGSVFGFGQLFSGSAPQKKDGNGAVSSRGQHSHYSHHYSQKNNRTDRN